MAVSLVFILVLIAGALFWVLYRRGVFERRPLTPTATARPLETLPPVRRPGHMLHPGETGCAAARKIETAWLPGETAGPLPLEDCDHPEECRCRWTRVYDRRQTVRREQPDRRSAPRAGAGQDRRQRTDRRTQAEPPSPYSD